MFITTIRRDKDYQTFYASFATSVDDAIATAKHSIMHKDNLHNAPDSFRIENDNGMVLAQG
jgi:hypothetical protein